MKYLLCLLIGFCSTNFYSQNIFEEKFEGCNTDYFAMESDSITVRSRDAGLRKILADVLNDEKVTDVKGILSLQILVDEEGNSCLLSIENTTNINSDHFKLKTRIDQDLKWFNPPKKTSVVFAIKFYGNQAELKRFGMNAERGFHELPE